jgi:hypothetical protein
MALFRTYFEFVTKLHEIPRPGRRNKAPPARAVNQKKERTF